MSLLPGEDRPLSLDAVAMIAIDLDGTLLRCDGSICFQSAEAIFEAMERGIKVVIATGRAPRSVRAIYKALNLDTPIICHNGALLLDGPAHRSLDHRTLDPATAQRVIEIARRAAPGVMVGVEVFDRCYTEKTARAHMARQPSIAASLEQPADSTGTTLLGVAALADDGVGAFAAVLKQPVTKIMFVGEAEVLGGVQMALQRELSGVVSFSCSHMRLLQVVSRTADKATALELLTQRMGLSRGEVMAIGDAPNDLGMIRWAGLGIALANGWPEVRNAAHHVVAGNDDGGVAQAIRRFALAGA